MRPEKILKRFTGETDGDGPNGGLILDAKGSLFGTTGLGGTGNGLGVVFQLAPQPGRWAETVLYSFQGENDGRNPGPLTRDSTGTLYGVAGGGAYFSGVVFRLKPPSQKTWPFALLYIFRRPPDGGGPEAHLILDGAGNLYSTTVAGGDSGNGTVFRVTR